MHYILQPYNYNLSDPASIPNLFLQHLALVGVVMLISLVIAIPVGIVVARYRRLYLPVITVSSVLYTIPILAAFAFLYPITGLTPATAIIPLVIYNQLILIRKPAASLNGIHPIPLQSAPLLHMKPRHLLFLL